MSGLVQISPIIYLLVNAYWTLSERVLNNEKTHNDEGGNTFIMRFLILQIVFKKVF